MLIAPHDLVSLAVFALLWFVAGLAFGLGFRLAQR